MPTATVSVSTQTEAATKDEAFRQIWTHQREEDCEKWKDCGMTPGVWMSVIFLTVIGDLRMEKKAEMDKLALIEYCASRNIERDALSPEFKEEFDIMLTKKKSNGLIKHDFKLSSGTLQTLQNLQTGIKTRLAKKADAGKSNAGGNNSTAVTPRKVGLFPPPAPADTDPPKIQDAPELAELLLIFVQFVPIIFDTNKGETMEVLKKHIKFAFKFMVMVHQKGTALTDCVNCKFLPMMCNQALKNRYADNSEESLCLLALMHPKILVPAHLRPMINANGKIAFSSA